MRSNEARLVQLTLLEVADAQRNGVAVRSCATGDLAENEIIAGEIHKDQRRPTLSEHQIGLRKGDDDDFTGYRFAHAWSSSELLQSLAKADLLNASPSNRCSSALFLSNTTNS